MLIPKNYQKQNWSTFILFFKNILLCFFFTILFSTCQKKEKTEIAHIDGRVFEFGTNLPQDDIKVFVEAFRENRKGVYEYYKIFKTHTDIDGYYELNFDKISTATHFLNIETNDTNHTKGATYLNSKNGSFNFFIIPKAYLKIRLKKNNSTNKVRFYLSCGKTNLYFENYDVKDTLLPEIFKLDAYHTNYITISISKVIKDSIIPNKGDTITRTMFID